MTARIKTVRRLEDRMRYREGTIGEEARLFNNYWNEPMFEIVLHVDADTMARIEAFLREEEAPKGPKGLPALERALPAHCRADCASEGRPCTCGPVYEPDFEEP